MFIYSEKKTDNMLNVFGFTLPSRMLRPDSHPRGVDPPLDQPPKGQRTSADFDTTLPPPKTERRGVFLLTFVEELLKKMLV
jgi:hypothetical protein